MEKLIFKIRSKKKLNIYCTKLKNDVWLTCSRSFLYWSKLIEMNCSEIKKFITCIFFKNNLNSTSFDKSFLMEKIICPIFFWSFYFKQQKQILQLRISLLFQAWNFKVCVFLTNMIWYPKSFTSCRAFQGQSGVHMDLFQKG